MLFNIFSIERLNYCYCIMQSEKNACSVQLKWLIPTKKLEKADLLETKLEKLLQFIDLKLPIMKSQAGRVNSCVHQNEHYFQKQ